MERGFDFLGYFLKHGMVNVSISTLKRFAQRIIQLYEQGADYVCIGEYVKHWFKWVRGGITGTDKILINIACPSFSPCVSPLYWFLGQGGESFSFCASPGFLLGSYVVCHSSSWTVPLVLQDAVVVSSVSLVALIVFGPILTSVGVHFSAPPTSCVGFEHQNSLTGLALYSAPLTSVISNISGVSIHISSSVPGSMKQSSNQ